MVRLISVDVERVGGEQTLVMVVDVFAMKKGVAEERAKAKIRRRFPGMIGDLRVGMSEEVEGGYVKRYNISVLAPLHEMQTEMGFEEVINFFSRML